MALQFNTNMAKGLKLKVKKVWELIPIFAEVTRESPHPLMLNRVKSTSLICDTLNMLV